MRTYDYSQAYTRSLKSKLLTPADYEQLLVARSLTELINGLKKFAYGRFLASNIIKKDLAAGIEAAFWQSFQHDLARIEQHLPSEGQVVLAQFKGLWDVQNIKTVLRGKYVLAEPAEIKANLVLGGNLAPPVFFELAKQPEIKDVIDLLATWQIPFSKPLTQAYPQFMQTSALIVLETALDKFYFRQALKNLQKRSFNFALAREIFRRQIDAVNIITLLRLIREQQQQHAEQFFIDGGQEISFRFYAQLSKEKKLENVLAALKDSSYLKNYQSRADKKISHLEREVENENYRRLRKLFYADPLSLAVVIGYLFAKLKEITNLRLILRGKEVGLSADEIRKGLVMT